jgi:L-seryl-tRNA(Ser) seleniumtransferase
MIDDVGAGVLMDFSQFGFEHEPTLAESVDKGADVITASADKLIGASQGGIILGKSNMIQAIRKNQFSRVLRVGKLTLAVLEATLKLFLDESVAIREIPTLQMLTRSGDDIMKQAKRIASKLQKNEQKASVETVEGFSQVGSGSLPTQNLATTLVKIGPGQSTAESLAKQLRQYATPIFARIQKEHVLIDPRTLRDGDEKIVVTALLEILNKKTE